jgi:tetratricopeptide (TPR) repeat protein
MISLILSGVWALLVSVASWVGQIVPGMPALLPAPAAIEQQAPDNLAKKAFAATNAGDFATAENYWTQLIDRLPNNAALWSNRGNSRVSQNKLEAAIADYNKAIFLAPDAPDPYLNRGAALEGLGQWQAALTDYRQAADIAPDYAFARANYALALYQTGQTEEAIRTMRNLVRKYPKFPDMRAALTAVLWEQGQRGEAESNWVAVVGLDSRYKDINWVASVRRWPPKMVSALNKFLHLQ